jgi:hypothetical protein
MFNFNYCRWAFLLCCLSLTLLPIDRVAGQQGESVEALSLTRDPELKEWELVDNGWKTAADDSGEKFLSLATKASNYQPKYRSPTHLALWKTEVDGDFELDIEVKSTHPDYGHRDVVLFLGYQNPDQYYYVHLAKAMDENANQVFIVNQAARKKISTTTTAGVPWDDAWHTVRIRREVSSGKFTVYFDDLTKPVMAATDKTFGKGRIGVGSFDDTADFRKVQIRKLPETPKSPLEK